MIISSAFFSVSKFPVDPSALSGTYDAIKLYCS